MTDDHAGERMWTVEEANAALPRVTRLLERIRELVAAAERQREGAEERIGGNGATTCFAMTACDVGPVNGGTPPSISYSTQPRL